MASASDRLGSIGSAPSRDSVHFPGLLSNSISASSGRVEICSLAMSTTSSMNAAMLMLAGRPRSRRNPPTTNVTRLSSCSDSDSASSSDSDGGRVKAIGLLGDVARLRQYLWMPQLIVRDSGVQLR